MNDKSIRKREYILEVSRKVFAQKGYKNVTMKDIVDACEISRGGLYIYFDCVETLFRAVIENEQKKNDPEEAALIPENPCNADILTLFFREQKKEIFDKKNSLIGAIYEFSFMQKSYREETIITKQKEAGEMFLVDLIKKGIQTGEFKETEPLIMARHILLILEGMKIMSQTGKITEKEVNDELVFIMKMLLNTN